MHVWKIPCDFGYVSFSADAFHHHFLPSGYGLHISLGFYVILSPQRNDKWKRLYVRPPFLFYMSGKWLVLSLITLLTLLLVCGCTTFSPTTVQTTHVEPVVVDIRSTPLGAEIYFDGEYRGTTPGTLKGVSEGTHDIELRLQNYVTVSKRIEVTSGSDIYLDVAMERSLSGPPTTSSATPSQTSRPTTVKTTVPTTVKTTVPTTMPTAGPTETPQRDSSYWYSVAFTAKTDGDRILVTYQGGPDHSHLTNVRCTLNGIEAISDGSPIVGKTYTLQRTSHEDNVIVVGVFNGNREQVVLDVRFQAPPPTVYPGVPDPTYPMMSSCALETIGNIYGSAGGGQSIEKIAFMVALSSGGSPIDMSKTLITFSTAERRVILQKSNGATSNTWRIANKFDTVTDDDMLESGESFELELTLSPGIRPNEQFRLEIQPQFGAAYPIARTAPPEISSGGVYTLY